MRTCHQRITFLALVLSACGGGPPAANDAGPPVPGYLVYVHDREGSVLAAIDDQGHTLSTSNDDGFGLRLSSTGTPVPRDFLDQDLDPETGYLHFKHRYYDPATAQWISPDPKVLGAPDCSSNVSGCNPYGFAGNRPLEWKDPDGLWVQVLQDADGVWHQYWTIGFTGPDAAHAQQLMIASLANPVSTMRITVTSAVFPDRTMIPPSYTTVFASHDETTSQADIHRSEILLANDALSGDPLHAGYTVKHELWHALGNDYEGYSQDRDDHSVSKQGMETDIRGNYWNVPKATLALDGELSILKNVASANQGLMAPSAIDDLFTPADVVTSVGGF